MINDAEALAGSGIIRTVYDPACGTGGMLALMEEAMKGFNNKIRVELYGQELNPESFGICKSDMLITGHNPEQIAFGNTLTEDAHKDKKFHYMLSNPPYGVDWKKYQDPIKEEAQEMGKDGRFGAGLPRISDGQLLFLQHMISKMRDDEVGSRTGIVMNGSPLFTGGAGSGESEIRRWMFENDWVEAIRMTSPSAGIFSGTEALRSNLAFTAPSTSVANACRIVSVLLVIYRLLSLWESAIMKSAVSGAP